MNRLKLKLENFFNTIDKKKLVIILSSIIVLIVIILLAIYLFTGNKFELNKIEVTLDLVQNKTYKLYTTLSDSKNSAVKWTSSDEKVVSIDKDGNVSVVNVGQAVITAEYRGMKKTCVFTVNNLPRTLTMDKQVYLDLEKNREYQLDVNIYIDIVTYDSKFKSSDESVVKVSDDGTLTAVGVGTATVVATYEDLTADCKVVVTREAVSTTTPALDDNKFSEVEDSLDKILDSESQGEYSNEIVTTQLVSRISILETMIYLRAYNSRKLTVYVYPKTIENPILSWTSSNEAVATVDENGVVTGISKGTAIITATASNGKKTTCVVSVLNQLPESIRFKDKFFSVDMAKPTPKKLEIVFEPENSSNTPITWSVSDESIISISSNGTVTPLKAGYVDVTASTSNGLSASTRVFVNRSSTDSRGEIVKYAGGEGIKKDIYYYMQGKYSNVRWCGAASKSIATSGCGATSLAIIISTLLDVKITPIDTSERLYSFGANRYCGENVSGTAYAGITAVAESYGLYTLKISENTCSRSKLKAALLRGDTMAVVIVGPGAFTRGGHYITLSGYDNNGNFQVYDPNRGWNYGYAPYSYKKKNSWWSEPIILSNCRGNFWLISTSPLTEIAAMC